MKLVPVAAMVPATWAEVGATEAGVGAASMVSGVDAAVAVGAGFANVNSADDPSLTVFAAIC